MNEHRGGKIGGYKQHIPDAAVFHADGNLSGGGLFHYESDRDQHGRTWRPDLVPAILAWIDSIPPEDYDIVQRFAVGRRGSFRADFVVPIERKGSAVPGTCNDHNKQIKWRDVAIEFDWNRQIIRNDVQQWGAEHIVPYARATLDAMARLR
ncbi:MAG TPA: hypothetical protein VF092_28160 [Longimicrobium sp.]